MEKIIQRGAEAVIIKSGKTVTKSRIEKGYRLPILDKKLRKQRTKKEAKLLEKAAQIGITVPQIKGIKNDTLIEMDFIEGKKLSEHLDDLKNWKRVCKTIGSQLAKLHDAEIIHGDLTTSNMILSEENKVFFIDFGLGFNSTRIEDRAVDLHLLKQALEARHFKKWKEFFSLVIEGYKVSPKSEQTLKQLEKVERRGRYKGQY